MSMQSSKIMERIIGFIIFPVQHFTAIFLSAARSFHRNVQEHSGAGG
jgi:hypothetical protein